MLGDASGHRGGPLTRCRAHCRGRQAETRVHRAKVRDRADQVHPVLQRQCVARQRAAATGQRCQPLPERGVEALNGGRVDHPAALRAAPQGLDASGRAVVSPQ